MGEKICWPELASLADSQIVLDKCRHHGVEALVFHAMNDSQEWQSWPHEVAAVLERSSKAGIAQDMLRSHYLSELLQEFQRKDIRFLLAKGEALALSHYPIPGTRSRGDSDLFISLHDIKPSLQAVKEVGFKVISPIYKSHQFSVQPSDKGMGGIQFDIHWRVQNSPRFARSLSFEEAFHRSRVLDVAASWRTLCAADSLMLACMHRQGSERHDKDRLIWLWDCHRIATALSSEEWLDFARMAEARNVKEACFRGLQDTRSKFSTSVPDEVFEGLDTPDRSRRLTYKNLGLLMADFTELTSASARRSLVHELFLPSANSLMAKYGKTDRAWLPLLYFRQVIGGLFRRVTLR